MVRCKFKLDSITRSIATWLPPQREIWNVRMSPVYANSDPNHENSKFWQAAPSGSFELSTVNKEAVESLELGKEYFIDITLAQKDG